MKPPRSVLDRNFRYVSAAATDVAKTFERIKKERKKEAEAIGHKITSILRKKA